MDQGRLPAGKQGQQMMKAMLIVAATMTFTLMASVSWSHGTRGFTESAPGIRVKAEYDDGDPISFAEVQVTAPENGGVFQTGRTDRNGIFMFSPDQPGKWRIAIGDGMGHRLVLGRKIESEKDDTGAAASSRQAVSAKFSRREGIVVGLSIIFGLSGFFYGWRARRQLSMEVGGQHNR
jgi:nickel transport protein